MPCKFDRRLTRGLIAISTRAADIDEVYGAVSTQQALQGNPCCVAQQAVLRTADYATAARKRAIAAGKTNEEIDAAIANANAARGNSARR